jgi:hypothetical protein
MQVSDSRQALEGKDVKDLLLNVGSGGGAAPAAGAAAGGAAAGAADAEPAAEEKAEGTIYRTHSTCEEDSLTYCYREGGVRRRHGLRSLRLSVLSRPFFRHLPFSGLLNTDQRCIFPFLGWK